MKTTLPIIAFLLIAWSGYGQSDSVTISIEVANRIEKKIREAQLIKLQNIELLAADQHQIVKIGALQIQLAQTQRKYDAQAAYTDQVDMKYRKAKRNSKLAKYAVPIAFLGGLILGR